MISTKLFEQTEKYSNFCHNCLREYGSICQVCELSLHSDIPNAYIATNRPGLQEPEKESQWDLKAKEQEEKRMDVIGSNGNDGLHYSDGSTASYYELPEDAKELQDIISYKNMNAQLGEIFRACYRYGQVEHSSKERDLKKIIFYAQAELRRIEKEAQLVYAINCVEPKLDLATPAKEVEYYTYCEGENWNRFSKIKQYSRWDISKLKGYAAIKCTDGTIYDFILGEWRQK